MDKQQDFKSLTKQVKKQTKKPPTKVEKVKKCGDAETEIRKFVSEHINDSHFFKIISHSKTELSPTAFSIVSKVIQTFNVGDDITIFFKNFIKQDSSVEQYLQFYVSDLSKHDVDKRKLLSKILEKSGNKEELKDNIKQEFRKKYPELAKRILRLHSKDIINFIKKTQTNRETSVDLQLKDYFQELNSKDFNEEFKDFAEEVLGLRTGVEIDEAVSKAKAKDDRYEEILENFDETNKLRAFLKNFISSNKDIMSFYPQFLDKKRNEFKAFLTKFNKGQIDMDINKALAEFMKEDKFYKNFISGLLNRDEGVIKEFVEKYPMTGKNMSPDDYLEKIELKAKKGEKIDEDEEEYVNCGDGDEEEGGDEKYKEEGGKYEKPSDLDIIAIDKWPKRLKEHKVKREGLRDQSIMCILRRRSVPWVGNVKKIYISFEGNPPSNIYSKGTSISYNGKMWYKASNNFIRIQCMNPPKEGMMSDDGLITYRLENGDVIKVSIFYELDSGAKILNDKYTFSNEILYYKDLEKKDEELLKEAEELPIDDEVRKIGRNMLNSYVMLSGGYLNDIERAIYNETKTSSSKSYFGEINDIIVYLEDWVSLLTTSKTSINKWRGNIFWLRLINGFYEPNVVPLLTMEEKLPYLSVLDSINKKIIVDLIRRRKEDLLERELSNILYAKFPSKRISHIKQIEPLPDIVLDKNYPCSYEQELYVKKDGSYVCYDIMDLQNNPDLLNSLSPSFIEKITNMKPKHAIEEEEYKEEVKPSDILTLSEEDIAKFIIFIKQDLGMVGDVKMSFSDVCYKCGKSIDDVNFKTIKRGKPVSFCSLECFEK